MRTYPFLILLLATFHLNAEVYRSVGPDGRVVYTDRPQPNAEQLDYPATTETQTEGDENSDPVANDPTAAFAGPYELFEIVSPENEHRTSDPDGALSISLLLSPALMEGHGLVIEVDGTPATGDLPNATQIQLTGLTLGTHSIRALVKDEQLPEPVAATAPVTVHRLRALPEAPEPEPAPRR